MAPIALVIRRSGQQAFVERGRAGQRLLLRLRSVQKIAARIFGRRKIEAPDMATACAQPRDGIEGKTMSVGRQYEAYPWLEKESRNHRVVPCCHRSVSETGVGILPLCTTTKV